MKLLLLCLTLIFIYYLFFSEGFTSLKLVSKREDKEDYIKLIDSEGTEIWSTRGYDWSIEDGEMIFRDRKGEITNRSYTYGGKSILLKNGGEFHGLNLVDKDGNIIWNPSHYSKFIDPIESSKKGMYIYRNPYTKKLIYL